MDTVEDLFRKDSISETLERFEVERPKAQEVMILWTIDKEVHWATNGVEIDRFVFLLEVIKHKLLDKME